jgi:hypothetical protein
MARAPGKDCKVCGSARQAEIDARLAKGETSRAIARWLSEQGEGMSHAAVARHAKNHLTRRAAQKAARRAVSRESVGVPSEAREVVEAQSENPVVEAMAEKIADAAKALDDIASNAMAVARVLRTELTAFDTDANGKPQWRGATLAMANLFTGSLKTAADAIVAREELLGGGKKVKLDVDARVSGGLAGLFAELEKREAADGGSDQS